MRMIGACIDFQVAQLLAAQRTFGKHAFNGLFDNALGELKILFPNAHAIYMHDTPSKSFFNRDMRALSHGCVRLSDPKAMAAAVLGTTKDDVTAQIATGQNKAIKVPVKIPVYVAYFTAWPNKDGVVQYFDDVYDRDAQTLKALEVTSKARAV